MPRTTGRHHHHALNDSVAVVLMRSASLRAVFSDRRASLRAPCRFPMTSLRIEDTADAGSNARKSWVDDFGNLAAGKQGHVRQISTEKEMREMFDAWTQGAQRLPARGPKKLLSFRV